MTDHNKERLLTGAIYAAIAFIAWLSVVWFPAHAEGPASKWGHDPDTSQWFRGLRSKQGFPCCDYADGTRIEDPDYRENDDGSFEVFARSTWTHIDKAHVVSGTNKVGYAILWWGTAAPQPYCFLPGSKG